MTASSDDAAASSSPPRAGGGAAAPSFSGTTGRPTPEESPMPHPPAAHDETVRMRPDEVDGRPAPDGSRPAPVEEHDDTRPVTRDWLLGGPEAAAAAPPEAPPHTGADDDRSTPALGATDTAPVDAAVREAVVRDTEPVDPAPAVDGGPAPLRPEDGHAADTPVGPPPGGEPPADGARGPWWRRGAVLVPAGAGALLAPPFGGGPALFSRG